MRISRLAACFGAALLPFTSLAGPMTYEFSGQVTFAGGHVPVEGQPFDLLFPWLTPFTGSFTLETATTPDVQTTEYAIYSNAVTDLNISFGADGSLGTFNFAPQPLGPDVPESSRVIFINDASVNGNPPFDQFFLEAALGNLPGDPAGTFRHFSVGTYDPTAQQFAPGQNLLDPLPVDSFLAGFHQLSFGLTQYGEDVDLQNYFESYVGDQSFTMAAVAVPEPPTLGLVAGAVLAAFLSSRRRRVRITAASF